LIITIFAILLGLTLILFFVGHYTEAPVLEIAASGFLFLLGLAVLTGSIQYVAGQTETISYTYLNETSGVINQTAATITNSYTAWSDEIISGVNFNHLIGFFLTATGALAFANVFFNLGYWGRKND